MQRESRLENNSEMPECRTYGSTCGIRGKAMWYSMDLFPVISLIQAKEKVEVFFVLRVPVY